MFRKSFFHQDCNNFYMRKLNQQSFIYQIFKNFNDGIRKIAFLDNFFQGEIFSKINNLLSISLCHFLFDSGEKNLLNLVFEKSLSFVSITDLWYVKHFSHVLKDHLKFITPNKESFRRAGKLP